MERNTLKRRNPKRARIEIGNSTVSANNLSKAKVPRTDHHLDVGSSNGGAYKLRSSQHANGYVFCPFDYSNAPTGKQLLQYVQNKDVEGATSALVEGTNPDFQDTATGNRALHIAVLVSSEVLVKLLIVFDANLMLKNHKNQTALDIAKSEGANDIAKVIEDILDAQNKLEKDQPKDQRQQAKASAAADVLECLLLSLDGGGIRGLVFIQVLLEMEKRRKKIYPNAPTLLLNFNWITGNSTGGIAALAFAAGRTGPDKTTALEKGRKMYFQLKDQVLQGDELPIPNASVDKVFQNVYGNYVMSDIKVPNVSVMTTLATKNPPILHIMSNYGPARNGQDPPNKQLVWKAARATSSVPLIFHPQDNKYLDGGLIANNPTIDAIVDMFNNPGTQNPKLKMVLSLGCGYNQPEAVEHINFEPSEIGDKIRQYMDKHKWNKLGEDAQEILVVLRNPETSWKLAKIVSSQITQPNGEVVQRSRFVSEMLGAQYFRINPSIDSVDFLTTSDEKLINMLYQVVLYMLQNCQKEIDPVLKCIYGD